MDARSGEVKSWARVYDEPAPDWGYGEPAGAWHEEYSAAPRPAARRERRERRAEQQRWYRDDTGEWYGHDEYRDERRDTPARIQAEIAHTRGRMDWTIRELRGKLSSRNLMNRALDSLGLRSEEGLGRGIVDAVRDEPIPLLLVGAGLAWLIVDRSVGGIGGGGRIERRRAARQGDRPQMGGWGQEDWLAPGAEYIPEEEGRPYRSGTSGPGPIKRARRAVSGAASGVSDTASGLADQASDVARSAGRKLGRVRERAGELTSQVGRQASHLGDQIGRGARDVQQGFWERYEGYPLAIGVAALAVGLIAGMSVPTTPAEDRLMGEASDELVRKAKRVGRDVVRSGRRMVDRAAEAMDEESSRPGGLAEKARGAASAGAQAAADEARRQGERLQDEMPGRGGIGPGGREGRAERR